MIDPDFTRFSYPTGYHYDVLRGLDYFRSSGGTPDPRVDEAIKVVRDRQLPDGAWALDALHTDDIAMTFDGVVGQPSPWVTLRALRVLRWFDPQTGGI